MPLTTPIGVVAPVSKQLLLGVKPFDPADSVKVTDPDQPGYFTPYAPGGQYGENDTDDGLIT